MSKWQLYEMRSASNGAAEDCVKIKMHLMDEQTFVVESLRDSKF